MAFPVGVAQRKYAAGAGPEKVLFVLVSFLLLLFLFCRQVGSLPLFEPRPNAMH